MKIVKLPKENLAEFIGHLSSFGRIHAPVTEFAEILRKSYWAKGATLDTVLARARQLSEQLENNADLIELIDLISKANQLTKASAVPPIEEGPHFAPFREMGPEELTPAEIEYTQQPQ